MEKNIDYFNKLKIKADNLEKGLEDWGDVYSNNSYSWHNKEIENKKANGKVELKKMKKELNNISKSQLVVDINIKKYNMNNTRKIFIL